MRLFHAQLLDEHLEGAGNFAFADQPWACLLSRAEALRFTCIVDGVSGGSPVLIVALFGNAAAKMDVDAEVTTILLNTVALVSGTNAFAMSYSPQDATNPPPKHLFLYAFITGTAPKAHVQVWVCGRGPQLLEAIQPVVPSFSAQYAAARMIEDEGRLPGRKQALRQGASLFYPPELFLPALVWER